MIIEAEIVSQPYSGEFDERIYDNESPWNSQSWTWVKFTNSDLHEWVGQFRGHPRKIAISKKLNKTIVLTSDYVFLLDNPTGDLIEIESQPQYHDLTVAPTGEFIIADSYHIDKIKDSLKGKESLNSPFEIDMIEFKNWNENNLNFTCNELMDYEKVLDMVVDANEWKIKNKTPHNPKK